MANRVNQAVKILSGMVLFFLDIIIMAAKSPCEKPIHAIISMKQIYKYCYGFALRTTYFNACETIIV